MGLLLSSSLLLVYYCVTCLDGVVSEAADDLVVVVLEAVDSFTVLRPALDPLKVVSSTAPVRLDGLDTGNNSLISKTSL